jgi:predicted transcriptional regulator
MMEPNDQFLNCFGDIERALRARLRLPTRDRTGLSELIKRYLKLNPYWHEQAADLDHYREIRNFLTHERNGQHGYPVQVAPKSVTRLLQISRDLQKPRPISEYFRRPVVTVRSSDTLAAVLRLAYDHAFSQFPVVDDSQFNRVITENEVTRWLGHQVSSGKTTIDLAGVTVRALLREREPDPRVLFRFERLDASEEEVMGLFQRQPALEVVLLTQSGGKNTPIEGIVTQWDAARYPNGENT